MQGSRDSRVDLRKPLHQARPLQIPTVGSELIPAVAVAESTAAPWRLRRVIGAALAGSNSVVATGLIDVRPAAQFIVVGQTQTGGPAAQRRQTLDAAEPSVNLILLLLRSFFLVPAAEAQHPLILINCVLKPFPMLVGFVSLGLLACSVKDAQIVFGYAGLEVVQLLMRVLQPGAVVRDYLVPCHGFLLGPVHPGKFRLQLAHEFPFAPHGQSPSGSHPLNQVHAEPDTDLAELPQILRANSLQHSSNGVAIANALLQLVSNPLAFCLGRRQSIDKPSNVAGKIVLTVFH